MQGSQLVVGRRYGLRLDPRAGEPLLEVKLLEKVGRKGMVKIRHLGDPHPGLEEYVRTRQIVTPWGQRRQFLQDKQRLRTVHDMSGARRDPTLVIAIDTVLGSTGHPDGGLNSDGSLHMAKESFDNITLRAGLTSEPQDLHPAGFIGRDGRIRLPLDGAETLARAFAAAEPETVTLYIDDCEQEYKARGYLPGSRWWHDFPREHEPGFALARHWAGHEQEVPQLRHEVDRLQDVVAQAVMELSKAGLAGAAARIEGAMRGR